MGQVCPTSYSLLTPESKGSWIWAPDTGWSSTEYICWKALGDSQSRKGWGNRFKTELPGQSTKPDWRTSPTGKPLQLFLIIRCYCHVGAKNSASEEEPLAPRPLHSQRLSPAGDDMLVPHYILSHVIKSWIQVWGRHMVLVKCRSLSVPQEQGSLRRKYLNFHLF